MPNNANPYGVDNSNVNISENVIANIAKVAAEEIPGVSKIKSSVTASITDIFGKNKSQGVHVNCEGKQVTVDIAVELKYGEKINEVCLAIQKNIINSVEMMTDLRVSAVNVNVTGLNLETIKNKDI